MFYYILINRNMFIFFILDHFINPVVNCVLCQIMILFCCAGVVTGVCDMMPGQIPDPSVTAGSLASLGPLAGISATTLTDQLKYADLCNLGAMLSPFHLLGKLKRPLPIKVEVRHHFCRLCYCPEVVYSIFT